MNNKKLLLLVIPLIASGIAISHAKSQDFVQTNAAFEMKNVLEDTFESNVINEELWTIKGNASLKHHYSSMRLSPKQYTWDGGLNLNKKLEGSYSVKITLQTTNLGGWFAVSFGNIYNNSAFASSKGGVVFFDNNYAMRLDIPEDHLVAIDDYHVSPFTNEVNTKRDVVFDIVKVTNDKTLMQCSIYQNDELVGQVFDLGYLYNYSLDGYMSFNSNLKNVEIFNVEIKDYDDTLIYEDDFSTSKVMYPSSGTSNSEWYSISYNERELKVGYKNSLALNDVGDALVSNSPLAIIDDKDLDNVYEINAEMNYASMDFDVETGIEIGKASKDEVGYFFGVRRLAIGYSLVSYGPAGEETVLDYKQENANMTIPLVLDVYRDGRVTYKAGELEYNTTIDHYDGYYALTNNSHSNASHGVGAYINYITINRNNHLLRDNKDIYMNFNGIKKTYFEDIDEYAYDYYISKKEWNIGSGVSSSPWKMKDNGNGRLQFNQSNSLSFFGPKTMYKDFVVKFDVEITNEEVPLNGRLGLQFGNVRSGLYYENTQSLGISYQRDEGGVMRTVPFATNVDYVPGANSVFIDDQGESADIFKDNGKFTLMYIAENNVVSLYYVTESEEEYKLNKVRTSVMTKDNETTDGLLAIYGAEGISFTIDNLSIINLDYEAVATGYAGESNYQEVTRIDFTKEETIQGVNLVNNTKSSNKMRLNDNGSLTTSKLVNDGIIRLNIKDLENTLSIKLDSLTIDVCNKSDKYIEVNDSVNTTRYPLDDGFEFRESLFEIKKLGNLIDIKYISGDEPLSKMGQKVISLEINNPNESQLVVESHNGFADLTGFTFINLNKHVSMKGRDFDPDTDGVSPWSPKEPINGKDEEKKKGCGAEVMSMSIFIPILLSTAAILLVVLRKKGDKKHEK